MTFIVIGQVVHRRKLDFVGIKAHSLMLQLTMNNFLSVLNIRITPLGKFVEEVVHYCSKKDCEKCWGDVTSLFDTSLHRE